MGGGQGLSYTTFQYANATVTTAEPVRNAYKFTFAARSNIKWTRPTHFLTCSRARLVAAQGAEVVATLSVQLTNTGSVTGTEVVQVYCEDPIMKYVHVACMHTQRRFGS